MAGFFLTVVVLGLAAAVVTPQLLSKPTSPVSSVTVRDSDFTVVKRLSAVELDAFATLWQAKTRIEGGFRRGENRYKLDVNQGNESGRWLYHPSGEVVLLTVKLNPVYKVSDPAAFNKILGITETIAVNSVNQYLEDLAPRLESARRLPVGTKTTFRCPRDLEQFKGIPMSQISSALSEPDYIAGNQHSYFLTSPIPAGQRGGGFPELTFVFSKARQVVRATCFYAQ